LYSDSLALAGSCCRNQFTHVVQILPFIQSIPRHSAPSFELLGSKLVCECQMVRDDEKRRRMELERIFGVDFGGPEGRGLGLV